MTNRYFQKGPLRAARVQTLFASIARRYDLLNDLQSLGLHRHWKNRLVRELNPRPEQTALDLCCGTGDIALRLRAAGARVLAVDFSLPMLHQAQRRASTTPQPPQFIAGDGLRLPLAAGSVDLLTVSYGLRNLPDFTAGLLELQRVARPGATLGILDFSKPPNPRWRGLYFGYLHAFVPLLGRLFCGDPDAYGYILESLRHFPDAAGIARLLTATGWTRVRVRPILGGVMCLHLAQRAEP